MKELLPQQFTERMSRMLKAEYKDFSDSYEGKRKNALRLCELKTTENRVKEQAPFKMEPVPWVKNGFFYSREDRVSSHPFYKAGVYYLQEASAMTPADRLPVCPGEKVLDLCAAPGGKATALASKLQGKGLLVANEVSPSRVKALLYNLESCGAENIIITNEQPFRLEERFRGYFDKVLVDAPCSGEGMFRKDPEVRRYWSPEKVTELAALQKTILKSAAAMLKEGGMLMYSTCTFSAEENEMNVSWLLDTFPEFEPADIEWYEGFDHGRKEFAGGDSRVEKSVRIWPHKMDGEGHFMALFIKKPEGAAIGMNVPENTNLPEEIRSAKTAGGCAPEEKRPAEKKRRKNTAQTAGGGGRKLSKDELRSFEKFAAGCRRAFPKERLECRGEKVFLLPEFTPDRTGLKYIRYGLLLGELKKDRFEPSQALAMNLSGETFDNSFDLDPSDERIASYLRGETLILSEDEINGLKDQKEDSGETQTETGLREGWVLVTCGSYSLGFGKLKDGKIKNKLLASRRETG
ncbi:MAG: RsmB/NOP family class I SAM-dependent RNA methyltransferase [Firmicutes bacterium]|nr:RsmB/NOP family class I SAM-dependent RNA methyltransferase [Bacillota bacterium]